MAAMTSLQSGKDWMSSSRMGHTGTVAAGESEKARVSPGLGTRCFKEKQDCVARRGREKGD